MCAWLRDAHPWHPGTGGHRMRDGGDGECWQRCICRRGWLEDETGNRPNRLLGVLITLNGRVMRIVIP
jgi:hypothetical protein